MIITKYNRKIIWIAFFNNRTVESVNTEKVVQQKLIFCYTVSGLLW